MGFKLMTNFNRPYLSRTIAEFWKRWHISLSTWFKDYLYIPLGGNKVYIPKYYFNLFIVFVVSGLWHGANWTYIIWGAINGVYLVFAIITHKFRDKFNRILMLDKLPKFHRFIQIGVTFLLICFSWVFFRASSANVALSIVKKIVAFRGPVFIENKSMMLFSVMGIIFLLLVELKKEYVKNWFSLSNSPNWLIRDLYYFFLIALIILEGGKMMEIKDGKTIQMEKDLTTKNGTMVMTIAECTMKVGKKMISL